MLEPAKHVCRKSKLHAGHSVCMTTDAYASLLYVDALSLLAARFVTVNPMQVDGSVISKADILFCVLQQSVLYTIPMNRSYIMVWQLSSTMPSPSECIWLMPCASKLRLSPVLWLEHGQTDVIAVLT